MNNRGFFDPMTLITVFAVIMFQWHFVPKIWPPEPARMMVQSKQQAEQIAELIVLVP